MGLRPRLWFLSSRLGWGEVPRTRVGVSPACPPLGSPCAPSFSWGFTAGSPLAAEARGGMDDGRAGGSRVRLTGTNLGGGSRVRLCPVSWGCGCFWWWAALGSEVERGDRAGCEPPRGAGMGRRAGPMTGCTSLLHFPGDAINNVRAHQKWKAPFYYFFLFFFFGQRHCRVCCPHFPAQPPSPSRPRRQRVQQDQQ